MLKLMPPIFVRRLGLAGLIGLGGLGGLAGITTTLPRAQADTYNFVFDKSASAKDDARPLNETENSQNHLISQDSQDSESLKRHTTFDASHRWGIDLGGFFGGRGSDSLRGAGLVGGPTFSLSRTILLHAYLGETGAGEDTSRRTFVGFESDVLPFHGTAFDAGALLGFSTFEKVGEQPGSFYAGLTGRWQLTGSLFANVTVRGNLGFAMGDAGIGLRF